MFFDDPFSDGNSARRRGSEPAFPAKPMSNKRSGAPQSPGVLPAVKFDWFKTKLEPTPSTTSNHTVIKIDSTARVPVGGGVNAFVNGSFRPMTNAFVPE